MTRVTVMDMARIMRTGTKETRKMRMAHRSTCMPLAAIAFLLASIQQGAAQQTPTVSQGQSVYTAGTSRAGAAATSGARNPSLAEVPPDFAKLKLAPGFLMSLTVLDDSDFDGEFRVDEQGNLTLPILGSVRVEGETVSEAQAQIQQKLLD